MSTCWRKYSRICWKPWMSGHWPDVTWSCIICMASCRVCEIWFRLLAAKQYFQLGLTRNGAWAILGRNSAKYLWITCVLICHAFTVLITLTYVDECKKHLGNHQSPTLSVIIADHQMLLGDKLVIIKCYVGFIIGDQMQKIHWIQIGPALEYTLLGCVLRCLGSTWAQTCENFGLGLG